MEVILLERVAKLGQMGETVRVRDGYARNFLLARGKALRATEENKKRFETQRAQLEARNLELKREADSVAESLDGQSVVILESACLARLVDLHSVRAAASEARGAGAVALRQAVAWVDERSESSLESGLRMLVTLLGRATTQAWVPGVGHVDIVLDGWLALEQGPEEGSYVVADPPDSLEDGGRVRVRTP